MSVYTWHTTELLDVWRALRREGGLTLDLIYGPQAWRCVSTHASLADDIRMIHWIDVHMKTHIPTTQRAARALAGRRRGW